ncbi:hypothetical protein ACS0TY_024137 [Phlomoides rotata]
MENKMETLKLYIEEDDELLVESKGLGGSIANMDLCLVAFWVQIYDLPIGSFTEEVGCALGNFIGRFLEYDVIKGGAVWKAYMRIRVEINIILPLKRFKKIKLVDGNSMIVTFRYGRLNTFCFIYGRLGHTDNLCGVLFDSPDRVVKREWGVFLKAPIRGSNWRGADKWLKSGIALEEGDSDVGKGEKSTDGTD